MLLGDGSLAPALCPAQSIPAVPGPGPSTQAESHMDVDSSNLMVPAPKIRDRRNNINNKNTKYP